jgi:hypothetical protein
MALEPEAIDLEGLPRTIGGGLKREPVEELLKRVQWEYSQLYYEHKRLKTEFERRGGADRAVSGEVQLPSAVSEDQPAAPPAPEPAAVKRVTRPDLDDGPVARIERALQAKPSDAVPVAPAIGPPDARPADRAPRKELDDLARLVLAAVQRTSVELRESARRDCELMLKKTRERAFELQRDAARTTAKRTAELVELEQTKAKRTLELGELEAMLREIREQMQATLEVLSPVQPERDPDPKPDVTVLRSAEAPGENGDSNGDAPQVAGRTELEAAS